MKRSTERELLLAAVRSSRRELGRGLLQTREAADFPSRVKASVQKNLVWWAGGAVLAGLYLASTTGRRSARMDAKTGEKLSKSRRSSLFSAIARLSGFLFSLSSPILKAFLTREVAGVLSKLSRDE